MSKGTVGILQAFFLASVAALIGGCDINAASPQVPNAASVSPESQPPGVRYQVDLARNRVWSLSPEGVILRDRRAPEKIVKLQLPHWQWASAPYARPPVFALGPRGEVLVTSNVLQTLWRIDPETLAVTEHPLALDADMDKDVGFSAIAYSSRHGAYYALSQTQGTIWKIDPLFRRAQNTPLAAPVVKTCGPAVRPPAAFHSLHDH